MRSCRQAFDYNVPTPPLSPEESNICTQTVIENTLTDVNKILETLKTHEDEKDSIDEVEGKKSCLQLSVITPTYLKNLKHGRPLHASTLDSFEN